MSGPAVGARGQVGLSQEGIWGRKQPVPKFFVELVSEGIVSEIGSLISQALRSDRAVHKRIGGVESAGGDIVVEVGPEGVEKLFKHALGNVTTTRIDKAFVLKILNPLTTEAKLTVTVAAGEATRIQLVAAVSGGDDPSFDFDLTNASYDTIGELMLAINAVNGVAAYSPVSYAANGTATSLQVTDYLDESIDSNVLEAIAAVCIVGGPTGDDDFLVCTGWSAYQHVIDAHPTLPPGMTVEVGRDIAAFTYAGCKVNTMELNANTGEIFGGTFNVLGKGATTASRAVPATANVGNEKNAFSIRYIGEGSTADLTIDKTNHRLSLSTDSTAEDLSLDISVPFVDPATGVVYPVHTVGGLVAYLNALAHLDCQSANYADFDSLCTLLKVASAEDITGESFVIFNFDASDLPSEPITWGDYKGEDHGISKNFLCEIVGAGVPGTATIRFSADGGATWGSTYTTSATEPTEVRVAANADSGFTVFFPDGTSLNAGDRWVIATFMLAHAAEYSGIDPFAGFDGALTIDGSSQPIMAWNCTVSNDLYGEKYDLGSRTRGSLPEQKRTTEGTMTIEFDNLDLYRRFVNGTPGNLIIVFTSDSYISNLGRAAIGNSPTQYALTIRQPKIEYNGTTPVIGGEGIIEVEMPYVSLYDSINSCPDLRVTLVNSIPYL